MDLIDTPDGADGARLLALAAALLVLGVVLTVFLELTLLFGGTPWLVAYVGVAFAAATLLAGRLSVRRGLAGGAVLLVVGVVGYLVLLPPAFYSRFTPDRILADVVGWLTGTSVRLMLQADLWAVSVAPAPVFLVWYLALRRRYDAAALAGGAALGFFVLTGDLGRAGTLLGTGGLLGLIGFGAVGTAEGDWRQLQEIGLVVGLAVLLTRLVRVVPAAGVAQSGSGGGPGPGPGGGGDGDGGILDGGGGAGERTGPPLDEALFADDGRYEVDDAVSLSPAPRFTVVADRSAYWRARSFDVYTGDGWRSTDPEAGSVPAGEPPPGGGTILDQTVSVQAPTGRMPAAWKPVELDADARALGELSPDGSLEPDGTLGRGDTYGLRSEVPDWEESDLRSAGTDYPDAVERRYLQVDSGVPARLREEAEEIAADAGNAYEAALAVQRWLKSEKDYSLQVDRPDWDVADAFVYSMEEGYCVYFATTMAVLLRLLEVPARFVVGYTSGERLSDGRRLLRGLHSHAWAEVYFPGVGWVAFDPTPGGPRTEAEQQRLKEPDAVEDPDLVGATPTPTPTPEPREDGDTNATSGNASESNASLVRENVSNEGLITPESPEERLQRAEAITGNLSANATSTPSPGPGDRGGGDERREGRLWLLGAVATVAFGSVRLGLAQSAFRRVWVRWQPRTGDPGADVERAQARLDYHLANRYRERRDEETRREYLRALSRRNRSLDDRIWRVLEAYHRDRYGEGVSEAEAREVVEIVDEIVRR